MATTCLDKEFCVNAWDCSVIVLDTEGNPVDPYMISDNDDVVLVIGEKPGCNFLGFVDENGATVPYTVRHDIDENAYQISGVMCNKQYYAKYCYIEYQIRIMGSPNSCFGSGTFLVMTKQYGDVVDIEAPQTFSCRFLNWTKDDILVSNEPSFQYVVTGNATFVAHYDTILFRITAKPFKRTQGSCTGSGTYANGESVTIQATPSPSYVFRGWNDGNNTNPRTVVVNGKNKDYIAYFEVQESNITSPGSIGGQVIGVGTYDYGSVVTLQAVSDPGWRFSHWVVDGETYEGETLRFVSSGDENVMPVFVQSTYTISLNAVPAGGGYFISQQSQSTYSYGDTATFTAIPTSGYTFVSWEDGVTVPERTFTVNSNISTKAIFATQTQKHEVVVMLPDATYSCAVYYNGEDIGYKQSNEITAQATQGSILTLAPVIPIGQKLVSVTDSNDNPIWEYSEGVRNNPIRYTVGDTDEELTLNFEDMTYDLIVSIEPANQDTLGNATFDITIDGTTDSFTPTELAPIFTSTGLEYNTPIEISAPSTVGTYNFSYWATDNGSFGSSTISFTMDKDVKCVAVYV